MTSADGPVGRNERCPCGSGLRYKHCHGNLLLGSTEEMVEMLRGHMVGEVRRKRQQGLGNPIVSADFKGWRMVAIHHRIAYGKWKTFEDFLFYYIKATLGTDWGTAEIQKPADQKHPVLVWYGMVCEIQARSREKDGELYTMPMTGVVLSYLGLAYDLFTLEHNQSQADDPSVRLQLMNRLRHPNEFASARHEIRVAAQLLRAGFELEWRKKERHKTCEYIATYPATEVRFDVECKIRQSGDPRNNMRTGIGKLVNEALKKQSHLRRIVFLEVNTPLDALTEDWRQFAVEKVRECERSPPMPDMPPAYVFITNHPYHHHLDAPTPGAGVIVEGYKIPDFKYDWSSTLAEALESRKRHAEIEALIASMTEHTEIPSTFDGSVRELSPSQGWTIGHIYQLGDGRSGQLMEAFVDTKKQCAHLLIEGEDGSRNFYTAPLTPNEMMAWSRHPDTFFGDLRPKNQTARTVLDLYDFFQRTNEKLSREQLLRHMSEWPDQDRLAALSQNELADLYSQGQAESASAIAKGVPS
jgi:hypothetical protein